MRAERPRTWTCGPNMARAMERVGGELNSSRHAGWLSSRGGGREVHQLQERGMLVHQVAEEQPAEPRAPRHVLIPALPFRHLIERTPHPRELLIREQTLPHQVALLRQVAD